MADSYNNIAVMYHSKGDYDKCLEYSAKILSEKLFSLSEYHPGVVLSHMITVALFISQNTIMGKLNWELNTFGQSHPDVAVSCKNIRLIYKAKGEYNEPLEYLTESLCQTNEHLRCESSRESQLLQ